MSDDKVEIAVGIKDGMLYIDGEGCPHDFIAVAELALVGAVSVADLDCPCDACVGARTLQLRAETLLRKLGQPPNHARRNLAADAAPAGKSH